MKIRSVLPCLAAAMLSGSALAQQNQQGPAPPVAGVATGVIGVTVEEETLVAHGWSAKRQLLGKEIYNDRGEALGKVDDIIVSPDRSVPYAIIGVGGYLGIGKHDVAIPTSQMRWQNDRFVLPGATRDIVRAMPEFRYAR